MRKFSSLPNINRGRRIAVAMSGGVDSSVAALLLSKKHDILGIHMSNWDYHGDDDTSKNQNCWEQDWKDAKAVAEHLKNVPIVHVSFESEYWNSVFEPYCQRLSKSITPNPDVDCNRHIKFGVLKEYIKKRFNIPILATGHFARLYDPTNNKSTYKPLYLEQALDEDPTLADMLDFEQPILMAARDSSKDQSYFLSGVSGQSFRNVLFPLGDLYKIPQENGNLSVREIASSAQLPTAEKRDSMGICFIGKRRHADFVNEYIPPPSGEQEEQKEDRCINVEDGKIIATFDPTKDLSLVYATIGQGAKLSGAAQKWFVADKPDITTLMVCPGTHHPSLYSDSFIVQDINWIQGRPALPLKAQCRIRHLQPLVSCEIRVSSSNESSYEIILERPLRGIAPGQVCGIYVNDLVCMGGGAITKRGPTYLELNKPLPATLHPSGHNDHSSLLV